MPKIPSGPKRERIRFCVSCQQEMPWETSRCPSCGHDQPPAAEVARNPRPDVGAWVYDVVPFIGSVQTDKFSMENASAVSSQLRRLINAQAEKGWEFWCVDKVHIQVNPGCVGALTGRQAEFIDFDQVVFRRRR